MRKTIYLHIGHYKTGTTALQVFLAQNRGKLLRRGVDYSKALCHLNKHSKLAFSLYHATGVKRLMHGYRAPETPEAIWASLFEAARRSKAPALLVSSEEFMRLGAHEAAAARLAAIIETARAEFDFKVIAYLRAPGDHLRSWYNQLVKMDVAPADFNTAVTREMEPVHYDYALALAPWVDIFGAEAVMLRPYRAEMREGVALYADFLDVLRLDYNKRPLGGWSLPARDVNPRLDDRLLELTRAVQVAKLPKNLQALVLERAAPFLTTPAAADFDPIVARARSGLESLAALPGAALEGAELAADLPRPDPLWRGELHAILALLLREEAQLRNRMQTQNRQLMNRLEASEARIEALERRLGSES